MNCFVRHIKMTKMAPFGSNLVIGDEPAVLLHLHGNVHYLPVPGDGGVSMVMVVGMGQVRVVTMVRVVTAYCRNAVRIISSVMPYP